MTKPVIALPRISRRTLYAAILLGLAACGSGSDAVSGPADSSAADFSRSSRAKIISSVSVTSTSSTVNFGSTLQLAAAALNTFGGAITGNVVAWSSSDTTVVTVSPAGLATAIKPGTASIKAKIAGISGSENITVVAVAPSAVTTLAVSAVNDTSATLTFTEVSDGAGGAAAVDVRFAPAPIQWGAAVSVTRGTCTTPVAGTTVGSTMTCTVLGLTAGTAYNFELVTFRGTLNQNAVFGKQSNVAAGTSTVPVVASVAVTPASATLNIGAKLALAASVKDKNSNLMTGNAVAWTSSNTAIATIDSTGTATGIAAGAVTFTATVAGVTGTAQVTVAAQALGTVANLAVATVNDTSATLTFTEVTDGMGGAAAVDIRFGAAPLTWGSATSVTSGTCKSPLAGTTVGSTMTCTILGLTPGTAYNFALVAFRGTLNVNAVFGSESNVAAATTTTVTVPVVGSVTVTPATATANVGAKLALVATVKDKNNNVMTGKVVAWTSSNTAIATIDSTGMTTGIAPGAVTLTATVAGVSGTASVTEAAVVGSVTVTPATATSTVGAKLALVATVKDKNNNVMTGQAITWKSSNAAVASVDGTGAATGVAPGAATITATVGTVSGSAAVTEQAVVVNGNPVIASISRDGGSAAGGAKVTIAGSGFGTDAAVQFAGVSASSVTVVNANTLNVVVPRGTATNPVFPTAVAVSVTSGGVTGTLANAWTYWPAPTAVLGHTDFENSAVASADGQLNIFNFSPPSGTSVSVVGAGVVPPHSGNYSLRQIAGGTDVNATTYGGSWPQSDIVGGTGRWHRWYVYLPAATLASVANNGQIKMFLSRDATNNFTVAGTGPEFRDPAQDGASVFAVNNDNGNYHINDASAYLGHYGTEPTITANVWHEVQVYEYRDPLLGVGYTKVWWDGKKIADSNNVNTLFTSYLSGMGDNSSSSSRNAQFGLVYTQNALTYPLVVYIDDITVANGYIDPQ